MGSPRRRDRSRCPRLLRGRTRGRVCCFRVAIARRLAAAHAPLVENDVWDAGNRHSSWQRSRVRQSTASLDSVEILSTMNWSPS